MRCRLAYQDTEKYEGPNPGVFLEGMDHGEAKNGNEVGDYGDDDTANADSHGVVGDSAEGLTTNDDVDDGKTTSDKDIENGAQFGAPEAKRVPRRSNGTETKLGRELVGDPSTREP